jgi:hypothetical protein
MGNLKSKKAKPWIKGHWADSQAKISSLTIEMPEKVEEEACIMEQVKNLRANQIQILETN